MEKLVRKQKKKFSMDIPADGKRRKVETPAGVQVTTKGQMAALMLNATHNRAHFESKQEYLSAEADAALSLNRTRENSKRRFWKEFQKVVKVSDVLLEVLDARDPLGCRLADIEKNVESEYGGKKKFVLILNKVDLVPKENVVKWLEYLRYEGMPVVAFSAAGGGKTAAQETSSSKGFEDPTHRCVHHLFETLRSFQKTEAGGRRRITVGIVGFPNVGKSSVINALKRERVVGVGNTPGVTTAAQEIHLQGHVKIVDCPGVVMTERNDAETALRNAIKIEHIDDVVRPVELITERCGISRLLKIYDIHKPSETFDSFIHHLAEKKGKLLKGGKPNVEEACKVVLKDWNDGRIHFYTTPPDDRDFMAPAAKTLDQNESEGETMILNALSSRATDFVCLTSGKPQPTTYMVDDEAISRKRKTRDDEEVSSEGSGFNPFKMYSDKHKSAEELDTAGGVLEDSDEDANEEQEEGMDEDEDESPRKKLSLGSIRKKKGLKKSGITKRRFLKIKRS
eukprot:TRINITY_DN24038_c0_g1_i1.p1 TRINITY_DN24038_c0_g1~~TRINITY_DN24038_c0_g1_i1.p1  ORF type:complete len:542 (+),score=216.08 TRINITY_DN24038_c0_g1_i1:97-1626(+)